MGVIQETANDLQKYIDENEPKFLQDQQYAHIAVYTSVHEIRGCIFFLDAPGGTGKTFVAKLLAKVRQQ